MLLNETIAALLIRMLIALLIGMLIALLIVIKSDGIGVS